MSLLARIFKIFGVLMAGLPVFYAIGWLVYTDQKITHSATYHIAIPPWWLTFFAGTAALLWGYAWIRLTFNQPRTD